MQEKLCSSAQLPMVIAQFVDSVSQVYSIDEVLLRGQKSVVIQ